MADRDFTSEPLPGVTTETLSGSTNERDLTSGPLEFPQAPPKDWRATGEDVGKAAAAKGTEGLVGGILGMPGTIEKFVRQDIPRGIAEGAGYVAERLDLVAPTTRKEFMADIDKLSQPYQTPAQQKGYAAPSGLPTYEGVTSEMEKAYPPLAYKPKTAEGKIIGTGAEFAGQAAPGALRTATGRLFTGFTAGVGSEVGSQLAGDSWAQPLFQLGGLGAGALAGAGLANAVRSVAIPTTMGKEELAKALAADFQRGKSAMTLDDVTRAMENGTPVTIYDMAGPETKKLLGRYADLTPANREAVAEFNTALNDRRVEAARRTSDFLSSPQVFGKPIDAVALQGAVEAAGKETRDRVYGLVRQDPAAASILPDSFGNILDRPIVRKAMKEAEVTAANNPDFKIVAPKTTPAVPSEPTGMLDQFGRPLMSEAKEAVTSAGNLSYWDQVKRELQNIESQAYRAGDAVTATSAKSARETLVKSLDDQVKGYKGARDLASETFGAANAPEAGYNFFGNMNDFKRSEIKKTFSQYSPEQKELFAEGFAHRLKGDIDKGNLGPLVNKFTKDKNFQERAEMVLGPERYSAIKGKVLSENVMQQTKDLQFIADKFGAAKFAGEAGLVAGAADYLMMMANGAQFVPIETLVKAGIAAGAAGAFKLTLNAAEKRIAERVIPMVTSGDPKKIAEIGRLATEYPSVEKVLNKMSSTARNAATVLEDAQAKQLQSQEQGPRIQRKAGGRVSVDHESEADRLIALAEKMHKSNQKATEPLLSQDDNIVAKALKVAHDNI